jgi:hypothetical protein
MKFTMFYTLGIIAIVILYYLTKINLIWLLGYLLILLASDIVPKRVVAESIIAFVLLAVALGAAYYGSLTIVPIIVSFLILATGIPGMVVYSIVVLALGSYSLIHAIAMISMAVIVILLALHVVKYLFTRATFVVAFIPGLNLIVFIIDIALTVAMVFIVFSSTSSIYPAVQNGVNYLLGIH